MDNPPGSVPAQRRTTLVAFLILLISVLVITVLMVLPYVLAVTMGGILAVLAQPVFQRLTGYHITPRVASAVVVLGVVLGIIAPLSFFVTRRFSRASPSGTASPRAESPCAPSWTTSAGGPPSRR